MAKESALFAAGLVIGAMLVQPGAAQDSGPRGVNHIGINVRNYAEAMTFYTKTLGLREAYTMRRPDGSPLLTYLQASRETFVELIPVGPDQPAGITHFGLEVGDIAATVAQLRQQGVTAADPGLTPARARFTRIADRDGAQIEVMEFTAESMQRKAMDAWK
jgi:catechol 2,3-dioxygenase-like lactoylglutathione lyase family enzyme